MIKLLNKIKGMLMYIMCMYRVYEVYSVIEVLSVIHFNEKEKIEPQHISCLRSYTRALPTSKCTSM